MGIRQRKMHRLHDKRVTVVEMREPVPYPSFMRVSDQAVTCYYTEMEGAAPPYIYACAECRENTDGKHALFVGDVDGFTHCIFVCGEVCAKIATARMAAWMLSEEVTVAVLMHQSFLTQNVPPDRPID